MARGPRPGGLRSPNTPKAHALQQGRQRRPSHLAAAPLTSMSVSSGRSGASKVTTPSRLAVTGSAKLQQWPGARASGATSLQAPGTRWRAEAEPAELRELEEPTVGGALIEDSSHLPTCHSTTPLHKTHPHPSGQLGLALHSFPPTPSRTHGGGLAPPGAPPSVGGTLKSNGWAGEGRPVCVPAFGLGSPQTQDS